MDYSSLIIAGGILLWAGLEYRRREQAHRQQLAIFAEGGAPDLASTPSAPITIATTLAVTLLLLFTTAGFCFVALRPATPSTPLLVMAGVFASLTAFTAAIAIRDIRERRTTASSTERSAS